VLRDPDGGQFLAADAERWRFDAMPGLEPTNNSAERALGHSVIWRRSSHGTQSDLGSRFVERILTVVETCRQQQRPVFDFLRDALIAHRTGQPSPSFLSAH
jgi:transposase